ncbi:TAXI family TRAP transporter solute-binding subunit [Marinimicrobium sp. ABcell2]|uniref:TAXI family TRAP transporter solute-binding subunit n=1 Tax=Marinimicrobium sp. ABcell2 TaxID=3069751 RepID=UPI0027B4E07F|nr:TAXI family TRAP transporter solute-binding subunit [Marinimicrobium sp. ABcell2]MDQ2077870.1 TAXI family TRAP transporter solute-binding subunit [Marinimicrobium sp. ABcell2]
MKGFALIVAAVGLAVLANALPSVSKTYSIATGSPSGIYYPFGGGLASLWSEHGEQINMKAEVTTGSVANLLQVHRGESEVGISQGDAFVAARQGDGRFKEPLRVSALLALYPNLVHLLVPAGSDIKSVQDLIGKRVSLGAPGSGNLVTARNILATLELPLNELRPYYLTYTETATGLRDGTLDAGFVVGGIGVGVVTELALTRDIRLIPFSDEDMARLSEAYPAYTAFDVPVGLYRGVNQPVQTVSLWNFLVVRQDMDESLAFELTRLALTHREQLERVTYPARYTTEENTRTYAWDYLHPGAKRYFDQHHDEHDER